MMKCHEDTFNIADRLFTFGAPVSHPSGCILTPIINTRGLRISQVQEARKGRYIVTRPDAEMRAETLLCRYYRRQRKRSYGIITP